MQPRNLSWNLASCVLLGEGMRLFARRLKRSCLFDDSADRLGQEIVHWASAITVSFESEIAPFLAVTS